MTHHYGLTRTTSTDIAIHISREIVAIHGTRATIRTVIPIATDNRTTKQAIR